MGSFKGRHFKKMMSDRFAGSGNGKVVTKLEQNTGTESNNLPAKDGKWSGPLQIIEKSSITSCQAQLLKLKTKERDNRASHPKPITSISKTTQSKAAKKPSAKGNYDEATAIAKQNIAATSAKTGVTPPLRKPLLSSKLDSKSQKKISVDSNKGVNVPRVSNGDSTSISPRRLNPANKSQKRPFADLIKGVNITHQDYRELYSTWLSPPKRLSSSKPAVQSQKMTFVNLNKGVNVPRKSSADSTSTSFPKPAGKSRENPTDLNNGINLTREVGHGSYGESSSISLPLKKRKALILKFAEEFTMPESRKEVVTQVKQELKDDGYDSMEHANDAESTVSSLLAAPPSKPSIGLDTKEVMNVTVLGPNGTTVPTAVYLKLYESSASIGTRILLTSVFGREILATHTLTGKESPAFKGIQKPVKKQLDPLKVEDIITAVSRFSNGSLRDIRLAITTKCADENKMMRKMAKSRLANKTA